MRYGRLEPPGRVVLADAPSPRAGPGELVIGLASCGVCGTDLEKLRGGYSASSTLGHEPVGVVEQVGTGASGYAVGDRVFAHHHVSCGSCGICARGDLTFCPTYAKTNLVPGGFAESFTLSAAHVRRGAALRLDPLIGWDAGALLEPAGCVVTALGRTGLPNGASVFIYGLGPVGLLYARVARALGAGWVGGAELSGTRRAAAERGGIDATADPCEAGRVSELVHGATEGRGVDLAVVATGALPAITGALEVVRRGGTVNLFGLPPAGGRLDADLQQLYLKGVRIVPSYATTEREIAEVQRLVVAGRLELADLVSHHVPLERIAEAFQLAARTEETLKVVVTGPRA